MHIEISHILTIFIIYFISFLIKGIAGFGDPLILNPSLSMFLENKLISPTNLLLSVPINIYMAWSNRKYFALERILFIVVFMLIGIIPGTLLLKYAASWLLKISVGFIVILIGIEMLLRKKDVKGKSNRIIVSFVCFCSGVTSGLYGINLFIVAYIERNSRNRSEFRGNLCFAFAFDNIARIIIYSVSGIITKEIWILAILAAPGVVAGLFAGAKLDRKLKEDTVRLIIITIFILGGVSVIVKTMWQVF